MDTEGMLRVFRKMLAPVRASINATISRVVLEAVTESGFQVVKVSGLADEELDGVEHMQPGGLTHSPLPGAEGLGLCVAGQRDHMVVVGLANRTVRPKTLQPGETALWIAGVNSGLKVYCKADGTVELAGGVETLVLYTKLNAAIKAMLAAGIGATGTNAFAAALVAWNGAIANNPLTQFEATKVKGS